MVAEDGTVLASSGTELRRVGAPLPHTERMVARPWDPQDPPSVRFTPAVTQMVADPAGGRLVARVGPRGVLLYLDGPHPAPDMPSCLGPGVYLRHGDNVLGGGEETARPRASPTPTTGPPGRKPSTPRRTTASTSSADFRDQDG